MQNEESSSQNELFEYSYQAVEYGKYLFETDAFLQYEVFFKPSPYIFGEEAIYAPHLFELSIFVRKGDHKSASTDKKISFTIAAIFTHFFTSSDKTVCIYICDSSDGKQLVRQRKFSQWFGYFADSTAYVQLDDRIVDADGTIYPVSLITKRQNPYLMDIIHALDGLVATYSKINTLKLSSARGYFYGESI